MKNSLINIIKEEINKFLINENLDHSHRYLYHFTHISNLISICNDNEFNLELVRRSNDQHKNFLIYPFYASMTRIKDGGVGYSGTFTLDCARITFDYDLLNQIPESKIVSHSYFYNKALDVTPKQQMSKNWTSSWYAEDVENEDRFTSKNSVIHKVLDYIVSIDLFCDISGSNYEFEDYQDDLKEMYKNNTFMNKLHVFTDRNAFNKQDYSKEVTFNELFNYFNYFNKKYTNVDISPININEKEKNKYIEQVRRIFSVRLGKDKYFMINFDIPFNLVTDKDDFGLYDTIYINDCLTICVYDDSLKSIRRRNLIKELSLNSIKDFMYKIKNRQCDIYIYNSNTYEKIPYDLT